MTSSSATVTKLLSLLVVIASCTLFFSFYVSPSITGFVVDNGEPLATDTLDSISDGVRETTVSLTEGSSAIEVNVHTTQYGAVLGRPVRWTKQINLSDAAVVSIEIPAIAENISIRDVVSENVSNVVVENETAVVENETVTAPDLGMNGTNTNALVNETLHDTALVNESVSDVNESPVAEPTVNESPVAESPSTEAADDALLSDLTPEAVSIGIHGNVVRAPSAHAKNPWYSRFLGRVTEDIVVSASSSDVIELNISAEPITSAELEYYTDAPYALEQEDATGKVVAIIGPADVHYEQVLAFSELNESWRITRAAELALYWEENETRLAFDVYDRDANGIMDYIEWVAPHLSNQTFHIILITHAQHLDANRTVISTIYDAVRELDGNWSESIPDTHYVRVTFEHNLTNGRDITVYPRTVSGAPSINVYTENGSDLVAQFASLTDNQYNRVILSGLASEQGVFDLQVLGGDVQFDHIIDPAGGAPDISFVDPTPANGTTQTGTNIYVNVSSNATGDHYTFVDFDNSLVFWMRMDDVDSNGNPVDLSRYSNNGTLIGSALMNASGRFGNASWINGQAQNYINLSVSNPLDLVANFTIAFWVYPRASSGSITIIKRGTDSTSDNAQQYLIDYTSSSQRISNFMVGNGTASNTTVPSASTTLVNQWNFVACRLNGTNYLQCFPNGVASGTATLVTVTPALTATRQFIGTKRASSNNFNGSIDDFMIFNRSLSNQEILALYNASATKYENNFTGLAQTSHTFTGYAVDTLANKNQTDRRFVTINSSFDGIPPVITIVSPQNTTYTLSSIDFNVTLNENGTVRYSLTGGVTNFTMSSTNNQNFNASNGSIADGTYTFFVYANDSAGNINSSSVGFTINISSAPIFSNFQNNPSNGTNYSQGAFYEFNVTLSSNARAVWISWNDVNFTGEVLNRSANVYSFNRTDLGVKVYNYTWWANNSAGIINSSGQKKYTVSIGSMNTSLYLNNSLGNVTLRSNSSLQINATINTPLIGNVSLYKNGELIGRNQSSFSNTTSLNFNDGTYNLSTLFTLANITLVYDGNENYSASTTTRQVVVIPKATAIARFDVVSYQTFNSSFNVGVIAFHINGISSVTINASDGTGNSTFVNITNMTYNSQSGVWEYWTALNASNFSDGQINISATAYPVSTPIPSQEKTIQMSLNANARGALVTNIKWVDSVNGNDATGNGSQTSPFRTIYIAAINISRENGGPNYADNGIIYLKAGNYTWAETPSGGAAVITNKSWLTIQGAPGLDKSQVIITDSNGSLNTQLTRFSSLTVYNTSMSQTSTTTPWIWFDNVILEAENKVTNVDFTGSGWTNRQFVTNTEIRNVTQGVLNAYMQRNVSVHNLVSDAFTNIQGLIVNCQVDSINNSGTAYHGDVLQLNSNFDNIVVYGLKATNIVSQGIFTDGVWNISNVALVNVIVENLNEAGGGNNQWLQPTNQLLLWHITQTGTTSFLIDYNSGDQIGPYSAINDLSVRNSLFHTLTIRGVDGGGTVLNTTTAISNVHIESSPTSWINGTNGTAGFVDASADDFHPNSTSVLRNRIPGNGSRLVPADLEGTALPTDGSAAIGALQYLSSGTSDTTAPTVTLLHPTDTLVSASAFHYFAVNVSDAVNVTNITLYVWNSSSLVGTNFTSLNVSQGVVNRTFTLPRDGTYYWNYLAVDNSSNSAFASSNYTLTYDATGPTITVFVPANTTYSDTSLTFNVSLNENGSVRYSLDNGVTNITMTGNQGLFGTSFNATNASFANGSYVFNVYANDTVGNRNDTVNVGFAIDTGDGSSGSDDEGSGGGGGTGLGFWVFTREESGSDLVDIPVHMTLGSRQRARISVDGQIHHVGVVSITDVSALINVSSIPQQALFYIGETHLFELTGDEYYDLSVHLNHIIDSRANLTLAYVHEPLSSYNASSTPDATTDVEGSEVDGPAQEDTPFLLGISKQYSIYFVVAILTIFLVLVIWVIRRLRSEK